MRRSLPIFLTIACVLTGAASANEHLRPEDSQFTRASLPPGATLLAPYHEMIITVLAGAFEQDVKARVVVMPSYTPEYALGIKEAGGTYKIFDLASESQLWSYENLRMLHELADDNFLPSESGHIAEAIAEYETILPDDFHDVKTDYCEIEIPQSLGQDILSVWEKLLLETRYGDQAPLGPDGIDYHFSMRAGGMLMGGKVWEPDPNSKTGAMVSMTETMKNLCQTGDRNLIAQLEPQVSDMLSRFSP
jgi:hypothetical protein